ncbi:hypothetical protein LWI29_004580 [Acer saccharum]|uniref:AP complex mu/sigma subunit domain-containing protein n=1 Tax=Acer saccharum TaxID=4024 RepID=A0AA39SCK3_ACESA|nr:hypothetical protein LWI29_004580 [Acer saccharum]
MAKAAKLIFSKIVTEIDITRSLSIPTSSLGLIPLEEGHSVDMHVYDACGRLWIFRTSVLQQSTGCEGLVLSVNWLEFVSHKKVEVDDKVIFTEEIIRNGPSVGARLHIQFVEILDHYFSNVCKLDLVFNFRKLNMVLEAFSI